MAAPATKCNGQPNLGKAELEELGKARLIAIILEQREGMRIQLEEKEKQITELMEQLAKLQGEADKESAEQKLKELNKHVNQPTSKKPEWDKDGNPKPAATGNKKKSSKKKKRKKRAGCGNRGKSDLIPNETHFTPLASCPCSKH